MDASARVIVGVVVGVIVLAVVAAMGGGALIEACVHLAVGWAFFLVRVVPKVSLDPLGTAIAAACMIGLAVGGHRFLRWLNAGWRVRWTGMLLALVVTMFVAGIAAVGIAHQTGWLLRTPGLAQSENSFRIAAARMNSSNQFKSLGINIVTYRSTFERFPKAIFDARGNGLHGWHTPLLPFYGQGQRYQAIDKGRPWNDPANAEQFRDVMNMYEAPGAGETHDAEGFAVSHYAANVRVMGPVPRNLDRIPDGASNTILIGEAWAAYKAWGHPAGWRDPALGIRTVPDSFGSPLSADSARFMMADGSARTVSKTVSRETLKALATPDGGEKITEEW
jgi:hypothetical protein